MAFRLWEVTIWLVFLDFRRTEGFSGTVWGKLAFRWPETSLKWSFAPVPAFPSWCHSDNEFKHTRQKSSTLHTIKWCSWTERTLILGGVRRRYINTLGGAEGSAWAPAASWAPQCHSAAAAWPREMAWGIPRVMQPPPGALPSLGPWLTMPCGSLALTPSGLGLGRDSITQQPGSYVLPARNRRGSLWLRLVLGSLAGEVSSCPDLSRVIRHLYPKYTISSQETHE